MRSEEKKLLSPGGFSILVYISPFYIVFCPGKKQEVNVNFPATDFFYFTYFNQIRIPLVDIPKRGSVALGFK